MIAHPQKRGGQNPAYRPSGIILPNAVHGTPVRRPRSMSDQLKGKRTMKVVDDHVEVTETEASGGVKGHNVRYVLAFSLIAVVIVLSAIWIVPALLQP